LTIKSNLFLSASSSSNNLFFSSSIYLYLSIRSYWNALYLFKAYWTLLRFGLLPLWIQASNLSISLIYCQFFDFK
jgi:hypothetical protein